MDSLIEQIHQHDAAKALLLEKSLTAILEQKTEQEQQLLPTVRSRLHFLGRLSSVSNIKPSRFQKSSLEMFAELTELSREALVDLLASEMSHQQQQLLITPSLQVADRVELLDWAVKKLNNNANLKLTIDWLLLRWGNN